MTGEARPGWARLQPSLMPKGVEHKVPPPTVVVMVSCNPH